VTIVVPLDAYLGLVRRTHRPRRRSAWLWAGYAAVAGLPVTVAFRDGIGALVDYPVHDWGRLTRTAAVVALLGMNDAAAQLKRLGIKQPRHSQCPPSSSAPHRTKQTREGLPVADHPPRRRDREARAETRVAPQMTLHKRNGRCLSTRRRAGVE